MDLSLTETQSLLRDAATEFMEAELPRERVQEIDETPTGFDPELWGKMCGLGWAGMAIPEEYGGTGNSLTDLAVIHEVLGYHASSSPLLDSAVLSAQIILEAGDESQKKALLPAIAGGQQIFAFAFTEPDYAWGPNGVEIRASRRDGNYVLNGTKLFIPWAHVADQIIVVARTSEGPSPEQGLSLFLVDKNARGLSIRLHDGWIGDKVCEVNFDDVVVPSSAVLGPVDGAWPAIERSLDRGTAILCTYMAGGAQRVYEICRDYSQTRIAFGVPIGTFQRVQDYVIAALEEADATKWTAYEAISSLDSGHTDAQLVVSTAKAVASHGYPKACDAAHIVIAGIGISLEFGLINYTKRARTFQLYLGDASYHKLRIARLLNM